MITCGWVGESIALYDRGRAVGEAPDWPFRLHSPGYITVALAGYRQILADVFVSKSTETFFSNVRRYSLTVEKTVSKFSSEALEMFKFWFITQSHQEASDCPRFIVQQDNEQHASRVIQNCLQRREGDELMQQMVLPPPPEPWAHHHGISLGLETECELQFGSLAMISSSCIDMLTKVFEIRERGDVPSTKLESWAAIADQNKCPN